MRGGEGECARRAEVINHSHAQGAPFLGIGRRAQLVQQHQRIRRGVENHFADARDMGGKCAEVLLDGLVVADVREHLLENGKLGFLARHWNPGLCHQRQQPDSLERDRLAAGIGSADQQRAAISIQFQAHRHNSFSLRPQNLFEQWMPRAFQHNSPSVARAEARSNAIEIHRETRFGENQLQLTHNAEAGQNRICIAPHAFGQLTQDAVYLAHLLLGKPHQLVVQLDGFKRLDEKSMAAGARAVNYPIDFASLAGNHWYHKTLVADGDELFLQHAFLVMCPQKTFE